MNFTRRDLLKASAASALLGSGTMARAQSTSGAPKNLIVIFANGGWDVTFVFDPKFHLKYSGDDLEVDGPWVDEDPDNPDDEDYLKSYPAFDIVCNDAKRPHVTQFFDNWAHKCVVVNGIWTGSISHDPCRIRVLTGKQSSTEPAVATILGFHKGTDLPLGSIDLSGLSFAGPMAASTGMVGFNSQITALVDPDTEFVGPFESGYDYPLFRLDNKKESLVKRYLADRAEQLRALKGHDSGRNDTLIDGLLESVDRAARFRDEGLDLISSLELGKLPGFQQSVELGIQMLEQDLCRAVTIDSGKPWDTHSGNAAQHDHYNNTFEVLDVTAALLEERGMMDNTLVAVLSEMTRTPKLNAGNGKDHWAHTSALLFGGGLDAPKLCGATDDLLESLPMDLATGEVHEKGALLKYDNLAAGFLDMLDIDPAPYFPDIPPFLGAKKV